MKNQPANSWLFLAVKWSIVSCIALIRVRKLEFSLESIVFSWYISLVVSFPSAPMRRLPVKLVNKQDENHWEM